MHSLSEIISYGHLENKRMNPHKNPGMEIVLVEQGSLEWAVEGVPEQLKPGTVFFTLPWQAHGSMHIREPRNRIFFVLFELVVYEAAAGAVRMSERFGFSEKEQASLSRIFTTARHHAWPASRLIQQLFPELIARLDGSEELDEPMAVSLLRTLLLELANIIHSSTESAQRLTVTERKVQRFLKTLGGSLEQEWSLDGMAAACGIKRTYFSNVTRALTGYPPMQYLSRLRFEAACRLLRDTEMPITEIGLACGYSSSQYFAETFKRHVRLTPTEYRRNQTLFDAIAQSNWSHPEQRSVQDEAQRKLVMGAGCRNGHDSQTGH